MARAKVVYFARMIIFKVPMKQIFDLYNYLLIPFVAKAVQNDGKMQINVQITH